MKFFGLVLFIVLFLSACTPSTRGTSVYGAFDISNSSVITVLPGNTYYFYDIWPAYMLGIDNLESIVEAAFDAPIGQTYPARVKNDFIASSNDLSAGWGLKFQAAQGIQTLAKRETIPRGTRIYWRETIKLLFALNVPSDATAGRYKLDVDVQSDKGTDVHFPVTVIIENEEN